MKKKSKHCLHAIVISMVKDICTKYMEKKYLTLFLFFLKRITELNPCHAE